MVNAISAPDCFERYIESFREDAERHSLDVTENTFSTPYSFDSERDISRDISLCNDRIRDEAILLFEAQLWVDEYAKSSHSPLDPFNTSTDEDTSRSIFATAPFLFLSSLSSIQQGVFISRHHFFNLFRTSTFRHFDSYCKNIDSFHLFLYLMQKNPDDAFYLFDCFGFSSFRVFFFFPLFSFFFSIHSVSSFLNSAEFRIHIHILFQEWITLYEKQQLYFLFFYQRRNI